MINKTKHLTHKTLSKLLRDVTQNLISEYNSLSLQICNYLNFITQAPNIKKI